MNNFSPQQPATTSPESDLHRFLRRHMTGIDITAGIIIVLLVMTSVFFYLRYDQLAAELEDIRQNTEMASASGQMRDFTAMFIEKVLKAEGEIDFETRLNLESAVRALKDEQVLAAWQAFTSAPTEAAAQNAVKNLLGILVSKIR